MPAVGALPPRGGVCLGAHRAQVDRGVCVQIGDVQPAGEGTRLDLRAIPAHDRQRPTVRSLRDSGDVPSGEAADDGELAGGQVEQAQPVPEPVLAHGALRPHHRIVARGLTAVVVLGALVAGHDGHPLSAGERNYAGDLTAPAQDGLGSPGWPVGGDPEAAKLFAGDVEQAG